MIKQFVCFLFLILATLYISGCICGAAGVTSSTVPITSEDSYTIIQRDVTGTSWNLTILGIPLWPISGYSALQDIKKVYGADALINVHANNVTVPMFIIGYNQIEVKGDAVKLKRKTSNQL